MRRLVILACLLLAACGGGAPRTETASVPRHATIFAPSFGDADPHDWQGRRPEHYPVHGVDLSRWNADLNWNDARLNGVNFAFIKATEGGDRVDPAFDAHRAAAEAAGVRWGAYHFYYWCTPAAVQARWFIENVPRVHGGLPPVLDVEWNPQSPTCRSRPDPAVVRSEIGIFLRMVERHFGQRPIIYTTPDFWRRNGFDDIDGEEFWLRSTAGHPSETYPGAEWVFWQYSGTGIVPGIGGEVDLNAFRGSESAWRNWLDRRAQP